MKCEKAIELLGGYLGDTLSPGDREEVEAHLASCADCKSELRAMQEVEAMLRAGAPDSPPDPGPDFNRAFWGRVAAETETGSGAREPAPEEHGPSLTPSRRVARRSRRHLRPVRRTARRARRRLLPTRWWVPLAAAAALLVMVRYMVSGPSAPGVGGPRAEVVEVAGLAELLEGSSRRDLRPGGFIEPGRKVTTGPHALLKLRYQSGSVVWVDGLTALSLCGGGGPPGVSVDRGRVYVETAPADRGFRVETPHGRIVDLGTRFGVETEVGKGTTVVVAEGKVEASTDAGKAEVKTGQEVLLARLRSPPGPVREAGDLERRLAWAKADPTDTPDRPAVVSFTLINADTDQPMAAFDPLEDGAVLNLAALPTRNLNVRVNMVPSEVAAVRVSLDGESSYLEEYFPYSLVRDTEGDYHAWTPSLGRHTLSAVPYAERGGEAGRALAITFHVVDKKEIR